MLKISNRRIAKVKGKDFLKWYRSSEAEKLQSLEALKVSKSLSPIEEFNKQEKVKTSRLRTTKNVTSSKPKGIALEILYRFSDNPTVELYNGSYRELKIFKDKELKELYKTVPPYSSSVIERLLNGRYIYYVEEVFGAIEVKVPTSINPTEERASKINSRINSIVDLVEKTKQINDVCSSLVKESYSKVSENGWVMFDLQNQ